MTNQYFKCEVPVEWKDWHISDLELVCHLIAIRLWGDQWSGLRVWGLTDSEPCELLLRHGRSRINRRLQMARAISSLEHRLQFLWVSGPIRSKENVLPDCLSRWRDPERRQTFWQTCMDLGLHLTECFVSPDMFSF